MDMSIVDLVIIAILIAFAGMGAWRGFVIEIGQIIGLAGGIIVANKTHTILATMFESSIANPQVRLVVAYLSIFLVITILVAFMAKAVSKMFEFLMLNWLNRLLGAVFGIVKGFLIVSVVIFAIDMLPQAESLRGQLHSGSSMYKLSKAMNDWIMTNIDMSDTYKDVEGKVQSQFQGDESLEKAKKYLEEE